MSTRVYGYRRIERGSASAIVCCPNGDEPPSSSGLGHLPFTQATRVRIPLGVLVRNTEVPWCSLECTPPCQGGGREFKSRRDRYRLTPPGVRHRPWSGSSVGRATA